MFLRRSIQLTQKTVPSRRENSRGTRCRWSLATMWLEERVLLSGGSGNVFGRPPSLSAPLVLPASVMNSAVPITIGSLASAVLSGGGADFYEIEPSLYGRLMAQTQGSSSSLQLRLSLFDGQGNLLVQSDGQSPGRQNPLIDQLVAAGADFLEVQSLSGAGTYSLSTKLTPASNPDQTLPLPTNFQGGSSAPIAVGDFNNDGIPDLVATDGVHLGTGDGTFEPPTDTGALADPSSSASAIAVGDFNGDGDLDAAVALSGTDSISIALGNRDGTFQPATTIGLPAGSAPAAIVAGDFLGNGRTDLAVADAGTNDVTILMGDGDGTFQLGAPIAVGQFPVSIAEGDFENDGRIDLAVADNISGGITILSNDGAGNFLTLPPVELPAGSTPTSIVAGDFGTGYLDLAVTDSNQNAVDILRGNGDGTFALSSSLSVGANPFSIVAGDFGNGHTDLATADANANDVSVLLGDGDGSFLAAIHNETANSVQEASGAGAESLPIALVAADFSGNGRLDLATGNAGSNDISVLMGKGDGTFEGSAANPVGIGTAAVTTGDFTGNGNLGVAVLNQGSDNVTILPGNGDGTFQQPLTVPLPLDSGASAIVAADFNGDGRTDLAIADSGLNEVSILLGNGDGTFESLPPITVAGNPSAIAMGDFGNGEIDLAVVSAASSSIAILMGNGDGTFQESELVDLDSSSSFSDAVAIVAGNFTGSGNLDLVVGDGGTDDVMLLRGNGNGTFQAPTTIWQSNGMPTYMSLVAGDFGNGHTDLAVVNGDFVNGDSLVTLLGDGDGTFQAPDVIALGYGVVPVGIVAGDFTSNGLLDLATADSNGTGTDDYSVFLDNGDGTFQGPTPFSLGGTGFSTGLVTGDFTGNGQADLAITRSSPDDVQVRLSNSDGTFSPPSVVDLVRRETPLVADVNGDGAPDVSVVDAAGDILVRAGRLGEPGIFASPVTVNPGEPSRDIAFVSTQYGPALASVDADDNAISFFVFRSTGFVLVTKLSTRSEPAQILSADLNDNGINDLIVRNAGDGTISVFLGDGYGWFAPRIDLPVGLGASDLQVADLHQNGRLDIVFSNRLSGEVGVLENLGGGDFASPVLYRAGPGPYGVTGTADPSPVLSLEGTTSVAIGTFTPGGSPSVVALDPGSNTFGLLSGLGDGRLANPTISPTQGTALLLRALDFGDDGLTGLAILGPDGLFIYRNDGRGGFLPPTEYNVGFEPNGLTVADLSGNGKPYLLISNPSGDVQVLVGNGDGTFQPIGRLDQQVALAVYAPDGNAPAAFIFADQSTNQLVVQTVGGVTTVLGDSSTGLISPGAVELADLNGDGILDLIVANSGSNNVLVYPGLGNGAFGPALNGGHGFFTGTNPRGITVADVNNDGRPDLIIANEGSNDVSILLNEKVGNGFTFEQGPRLQAGIGPVATVVADVLGNGVLDLVIANSGSNNVWLLRGLGNGFFNDQSPIIYNVGTNPTGLFVGSFMPGSGPDLVTVNSGSNTLSLISGLAGASPFVQSISSGGVDPTAAFAVNLSGNGPESLVVANSGSGDIAFFQPSADGLALSSVLSSAGLPNPSALALASVKGDNLEFYATNEGEQSASLLGFSLDGSATPLGPSIGPTGSDAPTTGSPGDSSGDGFTNVKGGEIGDPQADGGGGLSPSGSSPAAFNPTAVGVDWISDEMLSFYVSTVESEGALELAFDVSSEWAIIRPGMAPLLGSSTVPGVTIQQVARLGDLGGSAFDLIATLVTVTVVPGNLESELESARGGTTLLAGFSPGGSRFGQSLGSSDGDVGGGAPAVKNPQNPADAVASGQAGSPADRLAPWARFAVGLDDGWQDLRARMTDSERAILVPTADKKGTSDGSPRVQSQATSSLIPLADPSKPKTNSRSDSSDRTGSQMPTTGQEPVGAATGGSARRVLGAGLSNRTGVPPGVAAVDAALEELGMSAPLANGPLRLERPAAEDRTSSTAGALVAIIAASLTLSLTWDGRSSSRGEGARRATVRADDRPTDDSPDC
jgi:large repetitive protein